MSLKTTIADLAEQFATSVLAAIKDASLSDISELSGEGARRGRGRPRPDEATAARKVTPARRATKGGRRSTADLQGTIDAIVSTLKKSGEGMRSEQLQKALGLSKADVTRPLQMALRNKAIKKKGQKRATTYFAA